MGERGDTIVALSSGHPPAAVAVIRTSGPSAFVAAEALAGPLPLSRRAVVRSLHDPVSGTLIDQVLLLRFDGPASATGEDVIEYQCHGGRAVVRAILDALLSQPSIRAAEPGEFTRRAFHNGRIDLTEAEGLADLLEAETERQRRAALLRADGGLRRLIEGWRDRLVMLSARAEASIDYVDDQDETSADATALAVEARTLGDDLGQWLARPRVELLNDGIRIVAAGPPNAGKSSLVNALCEGDRAIVTAIPGTTRDVIEVPIAINGVAFILVDTAGLRDSEDPIEQIGVERAGREADRADIVLWMGHPTDAPTSGRVLKIHSQADRADRGHAPHGSIATSTVTGQGLDLLRAAIMQIAESMLPGKDDLSFNQRQAQEIDHAFNALMSSSDDVVLLAESLRQARESLNRVTGHTGMDDVLDALFGRFCLGK